MPLQVGKKNAYSPSLSVLGNAVSPDKLYQIVIIADTFGLHLKEIKRLLTRVIQNDMTATELNDEFAAACNMADNTLATSASAWQKRLGRPLPLAPVIPRSLAAWQRSYSDITLMDSRPEDFTEADVLESLYMRHFRHRIYQMFKQMTEKAETVNSSYLPAQVQ